MYIKSEIDRFLENIIKYGIIWMPSPPVRFVTYDYPGWLAEQNERAYIEWLIANIRNTKI